MFTRLLLLSFVSICLLNCKNPDLDVARNPAEAQAEPDQTIARSIPSKDTSLVAYYDFENDMGNWYEKSMCCDWAIQLTKQVRRSGLGALKFEIRRQDGNVSRSELGQKPINTNQDGWYAFSTYFPSSFTQESSEDCITQWQAKPDLALGEEWRSPPMLLGILNDHFVLEVRTDANKITKQGNYTFNRIDLGPVEKENWLDWVFHVKWAYDNTGVIEIWRNKQLVLSRFNQPNSYNDDLYPYFKIGLYKWDWASLANKSTSSSRVMYVDEVTIGTQFSSLTNVSPDPINALPVKLASFKVAKSGGAAHLTWATTEEANTARFEIERSLNARDWKTIGSKSAVGQSRSLVNYNFADSAPKKGNNYYRLKIIDNDRTYAYSSIKNVNF
ncbi:polysaccharide lyase [Dyadobacter luticola]|nr:polysaccharide lyase [Dyadobacter luticola]